MFHGEEVFYLKELSINLYYLSATWSEGPQGLFFQAVSPFAPCYNDLCLSVENDL